ncbi:MAG: DEAD/DEAH box helicase [Planctomycetota bacterium]
MDLDPTAPERAEAVGEPEEGASAPFDDVPAALRPALEARGFKELTEVQSAVLAADAGGSDLRISSQTGSGKTVALGFVVARVLVEARVDRGPDVLVVVPTRELAAQVSEELTWLFADLEDVGVASVTGGTPIFQDKATLRREPRVLIGTPGRLVDHVTNENVDLGGVRELVLDEADQMLDMGFREELEAILEATPAERRTHMVSATFPAEIQAMAERYQRNPVSVEGTALGEANANIEHVGHLVQRRDRYIALVNLLLLAGEERVLVFVERRSDAAQVATMLSEDGFAALPLSGELAQSQRNHTLASFRSGRATILVATDVAARGLDVPDVTTVIHTSPPIDPEVYTHRSGRTGRAGQQGRSVLLAPPNRRRKLGWLLRDAGVELEWRPVPSAEEIERVLDVRSREKLDGELAEALERDPHPARIEHAEALIAENDPVRLVATLLARVGKKRRARPRDVDTFDDSDRRDRGRRNERFDRDRPRDGDGDARPRGPAPTAPGMVRFFINWGSNKGANPAKVLAQVCRRGDVPGDAIGAISVHPNATTFDVSEDVAAQFEARAGERDERNPHTLIRRDRGPLPPGGRRGRRGGGRRRRRR